jgi:hypothetical protein
MAAKRKCRTRIKRPTTAAARKKAWRAGKTWDKKKAKKCKRPARKSPKRRVARKSTRARRAR